MRSSVGKAVAVVLGVTALAGVLRLWDLGHPPEKVFDEFYYARDGCWHAGIDFAECGLESDVERSWVHPPLGKQLIALGIDAFGFDPFGWRFSAAVAGTVTVGLVGILAFLLTGSPLWAGVGALLLATEHLHFVQSRVAMLDVFLAMFVVLGFLLLVLDRVRQDRAAGPGTVPADGEVSVAGDPAPHEARAVVGPAGGTMALGDPASPPARLSPLDRLESPLEAPADPAGRGRHVWRPLRLLAGAAFGAAVAVKWSGALALLGAALLALAWERTRRRRAGLRRPLLGALVREAPGLVVALGVVPLLVYLATWTPWLADRGSDLLEWVRHHREMASFHATLSTVNEQGEPIHPYLSAAWTWLLLVRPVSYYWQGDPSCCAQIIGMGNPVLFWGSLLALPYLALVWARRRDWRAGALLVPALAQYLPWLLVSRPLFLFYMAPVTPFLALGAMYALRDLVRRRPGLSPVAAGAVSLSAAAFAFFWPVLVGHPISREAWRLRMWFEGWI